MTAPRTKFQDLLKKLFQFDCAELDFGIYRIMNHKRAVIEQFINTDLLDAVAKELSTGALAQESGLVQQLEEVAAQITENFGAEALDAEGNLAEAYRRTPRGRQYQARRDQTETAKSRPQREAEVFNHLYTFFSRYYDDGDFMSLRRYSRRDKYAIPYNGEEVHLHWANSDQYYIKTGENFSDYSYKHGGWAVRFKLRNADVERNNVKGDKRFFVPRAADIELNEPAHTLSVPFEFRPLTAEEEKSYGKSKVQEAILDAAEPEIVKAARNVPESLAALLHEKRKDSNGNPVGLLAHHLRTYTRKNSSDFFIHKDLQGFLERELDFYLKNEVLNLDELEAGGEFRAEGWFQLMRTIKSIGLKIIAFVAQIEEFQKRLFEKKKFVTEVNYCVTLDRVPEELYPEIVKNKEQIEEWKRLFSIQEIKAERLGEVDYSEPLTVGFLKANPFLVLDTAFFRRHPHPPLGNRPLPDPPLLGEGKLHLPPGGGGRGDDSPETDFIERLLASFNTLDETTDGLLVCSENLQALNLLLARLKGQVQCTYIDPPYNTDASPIMYKNGYKESSWMSLMRDRLTLVRHVLKNDGTLAVAIDDTQQRELSFLLSNVFAGRLLGTFCVRSNPSGRPMQTGYSVAHEYVLYAGNSTQSVIKRMPPTPEQMARFSEKDELGPFEWRNLRREGSNSDRTARKYLYYPIYIKDKEIRVPSLVWCEETEEWTAQKTSTKGEQVVYPDNDGGVPKTWRWGHETVMKSLDQLAVRKDRSGRDYVYYKRRPHEEGVVSVSTWFDAKYSATEHGTALLKDMFKTSPFSYPKSIHAVVDSIYIGGASQPATLTLDFFGGSGTTAHAVINLNREDKGKRKYVLVEMGEHFDTALKPRILKAIYSKDWKDGKPVSREGSSHLFKYLHLESYEDALDNITFQPVDQQANLQFDDYVLSYMLDFETRESETLLNVANLDSPFDYTLRLHGKDEPLPVDLPETFNYLIGLHVATRRVYENNGVRYLVYCGKAEGRETVIIWRTTRGWGEQEFESDREFILKQKLVEGAEDIYVNSDSFLDGARSLDPVFKRRMFNGE